MTVKELFSLPIYGCGFTFQNTNHKWLVDTFDYDISKIIEAIGKYEIEAIIIGESDELIIRIDYESED